jgi:hypothetical protein
MRALAVALVIALPFPTSPAQCKPPPHDEESYDDRSEEQVWKRLIEQRVNQQKAGQKVPHMGGFTWEDYWVSMYTLLRHSQRLPWKGSEFKTGEDMVRYIKGRLKAHGLPTYE